MSRKVAELEAHLGAQLLVRTTRKQRLSPTGQIYYMECLRILNDIQEVESAVAQDRALLSGPIRIATPVTFGVHHLSPIIRRFMDIHPDIKCQIDFNDRRVDLIREGIDVAIRIGSLDDVNLIARKLAPIRFLVCASPDYLEKHRAPTTPSDLSNHQVLHYSYLPESSWQYKDSNGQPRTVNVRSKILANNGDFIRDCAIDGLGIIMEPTFVVYESVRTGKLTPILTEFEWMGFNAYAIYPQTRHLSLRVRTFIDFLVNAMKGEPPWDRRLFS